MADRSHAGRDDGAGHRGRTNAKWAQVADVAWGRWSMNEPTLWGMAQMLGTDADVFINLSGGVACINTIGTATTLQELKGLNFVTSGPSCDTGLRPTGRNRVRRRVAQEAGLPASDVEQ